MQSSLRRYLEFYRDLGFEDLYLPEGLAPRFRRSAQRKVAGPENATAGSETDPVRVDSPVARPGLASRAPDASNLPRPNLPNLPAPPAKDLFSGTSGDAQTSKDPLTVLQDIQADMGDCTRCGLHEGRSKIVFGSGNPNAKVVFVGRRTRRRRGRAGTSLRGTGRAVVDADDQQHRFSRGHCHSAGRCLYL